MKITKLDAYGFKYRRSLRWERGLKMLCFDLCPQEQASLPSLGAWIEDYIGMEIVTHPASRSLRWERGLKKRCCLLAMSRLLGSLPSLGAWIEELNMLN